MCTIGFHIFLLLAAFRRDQSLSKYVHLTSYGLALPRKPWSILYLISFELVVDVPAPGKGNNNKPIGIGRGEPAKPDDDEQSQDGGDKKKILEEEEKTVSDYINQIQ